jgi:hypothetical protein
MGGRLAVVFAWRVTADARRPAEVVRDGCAMIASLLEEGVPSKGRS